MKSILMMSAAVLLAGCYGYTTVRTMKSDGGRECALNVSKRGNALWGYDETAFSNLERGEKDCREWLKK